MAVLANRAKMTTATTGTGTITLGSASSGYQSFADGGITDGQVVSYVIEDGGNWELGTGTYTASGTTLSRTVVESNNSDAAINLSGTASVFITALVSDIQQPPSEGAFADGDKNKLDGIDQGVATTDSPSFAGFTSTANASFSATKQLAFTGRSDGSGSIDQLLKLSAGDEYGRPSVSYYDAAARHRAAAGFHERNGTSGAPDTYHDAYEIKTSADPAGGSPSDMRTRLSLGTDADLADVSVNYTDNFFIRDGSTTTFAVNTGSGDVTLGDGTNEEVKIDIAGSRSAIGYDLTNGKIVVQGGSGKGISFCTNNAPFGSGEVWSITSAGVLTAADAVTGNVMYLGTDNVSREFGISGDRAKFGYSGAETYMEGGTSKGVGLRVNGSGTSTLSIDSAGVTSITGDLTLGGTVTATDYEGDGSALTGVATLTGTQTLTNKTLTSPILTTPALGTPSALVLTNATGLPIGGIADGTDGELITWDAAGVAAAVPVGTATHVLTSNGAGAAPTFQAAAGGGGTIIANVEPTSDVSTLTFTGLNAEGFDTLRLSGVIQPNSSGRALYLEVRSSGGTWRRLASVSDVAASGGDAVIVEATISGFMQADANLTWCFMLTADMGERIDRSNAVSEDNINGFSSGYTSYGETLDEVRLLISSGNFEGSNADQRSFIQLTGIV